MRDADLARTIARGLGLDTEHIRELTGLGEVNHVFVVSAGPQRVVVRFPRDPLHRPDYSVEEFGLREAAQRGIPSPEFIARGASDDIPYIVQAYVDGINGAERPSRDLWVTLGRYARIIHAIPLDGAPDSLFPRFGRDLVANWQMHLDYNAASLTPDDPLIGLGVYQPADQAALHRVIGELKSQPVRFGLSHGDIVPKNSLLPPDGPPVLIDWGSASAGLVPHSDLLRLLNDHWDTGSPSWEEIEAFSEDCEVCITEGLTFFSEISLMGRLDLVRWAIDRRPDRLPEIAAKAQKAVARRLRGAL